MGIIAFLDNDEIVLETGIYIAHSIYPKYLNVIHQFCFNMLSLLKKIQEFFRIASRPFG